MTLGISDAEIVERTRLTVSELWHIEMRSTDLLSDVASQKILLLCKELKLSLNELLDIPETDDSVSEGLATHVCNVRTRAKLTSLQLDDLIGYEDGFIEKVESGAVALTEYPLELLMEIADYTHSSRAQMLRALQGELKFIIGG